MYFIESFYDRSPIFFQNIMVSVSGYLRNRFRYGKIYYEYSKFLEDFDKLDMDSKLDYQRKELKKFLQYAVNRSKFYKNLYKDINIETINNVSDMRRLPIIDKEMLRENIYDIVTIPQKKAIKWHTGGTTGKSLVVFGTKEDFMKRMALLDHFKSRVGFINKKMKRATFNGKHIIPPNQSKKIFWRYNSACKQMIYSSFHLTEENMKFYVESLNRFKPIAIDGFFTSIYDIAGYIERHNIKLEFTPVSIFPTSETLTKSGRELIENIFKCNVYDQYASSEGAPFVTECKKQVLHIELASGIFEHFKKGSNEILVTSFTTHGTPLIRYRIGDSMIFGNKNLCECGMEAPIVKEIKGRSLDFLYTSEGAKINAGNVANLFKNIPNVLVRAQLIQNKMDEIKILLEIDKRLYKPEHDDY